MKNSKRFKRMAVIKFLFVAALVVPVCALGAESKFSVGLGFDYATGDYGTDETTDSYSIPLIVDYYPTDRLDLEVQIPYLYQSSSSTVTMGGMRFPVDGGSAAAGAAGGGGGMPGNRRSVDVTDSQSGLGDITLTAGYSLIEEGERNPLVRPILYAKLPTADEEKGLGTGEFDFGGGLGLAKWFGNWSTYLEGMYVLPGSSAEFDPDNYWTYQLSTSYQLTERLRPGIALSGATAAFDGAPDALEATLKLNYWTSDRVSFGGYLLKGLSNGSPDYGAGIFAFLSF